MTKGNLTLQIHTNNIWLLVKLICVNQLLNILHHRSLSVRWDQLQPPLTLPEQDRQLLIMDGQTNLCGVTSDPAPGMCLHKCTRCI